MFTIPKFIRHTLPLFVLLSFLRAERPHEIEDFYPFSAQTIETVAAEDGSYTLPLGTTFVLVRVEGDTAVADVSRRGVFRIPVAKTNIIELAKKGVNGDLQGKPEHSRMAWFIGNKLVGQDPTWKKMLRFSIGREFRTWIFLYGDAKLEATRKAMSEATAFYSTLNEEQRSKVALIFMEINGDKEGIQGIADEFKPDFQTMPGYLAKGYTISFAHLDSERTVPLFVCVTSTGSIVDRHEGPNVPQLFWSRCTEPR